MINKLFNTTIYKIWVQILNQLQDIFLLIIRVYWGYSFMMTGLGKFNNWDRTLEFFTSLNIPVPSLNVAMASGTEFFGGVCLLIGFLSRLTTVPLIFTMLVAYLTAHRSELFGLFSNPDDFFAAPPFLFIYASIIVLLFGPGKYSADAVITK